MAILSVGGAEFYKLDLNTTRALMLAALFHDYDYDLNNDESSNIQRAQDAASRWLKANPKSYVNGLESPVVELIGESRYPHSEPTTRAAAILQDADSLMITQPDFNLFLKGLEAESGQTPDPEFPGKENLNTDWAKKLYEQAVERNNSGLVFLDKTKAVAIGRKQKLMRLGEQ